MIERWIRSALAVLVGISVIGMTDGSVGSAEDDPSATGPPDIELRKSFRPAHAGRHASRSEIRSGAEGDSSAPYDAGGDVRPHLNAVAQALGEQLQSTGTLHLPDIGVGGLVLHAATTPILETAAGRHLIVDADRTIDAGMVDQIARRWPDFSVVHPPAGADLRDVMGSVLDAAGYDSVLRSAPLIFGRGATIRLTPDFVVLRSEHDLLAGETRALSIVDATDAIPPELRELAAEHRVRIIELTRDGASVGFDQAPWRDPAGHVTTMETARLAPILAEVAEALGLSVERRVPLPAAAGEPGVSADLRISRNGDATRVFENSGQNFREQLVNQGETAIMLHSAAGLPEAIGLLLSRFGIPAIGPSVEFYRPSKTASQRRFVITLPGWLAEANGRRLLITGTTPPPLLRLYLTREGIDIFEYRVAGR